MAEACTIPRTPVAKQLGPFDALTLPLERSTVFELTIALNEFERPPKRNVDHFFHSWPDEIRRLMNLELAAWRQRNPAREVVGITSGVTPDHVCILGVHHRARG